MLFGGIGAISAMVAAVICGVSGSFSGFDWLWVFPLSLVGSFLACAGVIFLVLWISCLCVDLNKPQEKESKYFRFLVKWLPKPILTILLTRVHTRGLKKTPKNGRFLLVSNHLNDLDPVVLLGYFPKSQLSFITKRENMSMFIVGKVMHKLLCQPVNREMTGRR